MSFLFCPFLSFFVLFGTFPIFRDFPDLSGDSPGIFPICPFPLSRPIRGTVPKGSATQSGPFPKKVETPGFETPGLASLNLGPLRSKKQRFAFAFLSPLSAERHWGQKYCLPNFDSR